MRIRTIIIDDEPLARNGLHAYASKLKNIEIVAIGGGIDDLKNVLKEREIDLIFLDISLSGDSALDFIEKNMLKQIIVLTTAFSEFALKAYELDVFDYLLKPISFERFEKCVNKVFQYIFLKNESYSNHLTFLFLKNGKMLHKVFFDEIYYVQSMSNYYRVVTEKQTFVLYGSITEFYNKLDSKIFDRVHRSYIVNTNKITGIKEKYLILGEHKIPMNRLYKRRR